MNKTVFGVFLLTIGMGLGFAGCMSSPKADSQDELAIPTAGALPAADFPGKRPVFGRFNIHKRHGLGGWEGRSPVISERELLQRVAEPSQPAVAKPVRL